MRVLMLYNDYQVLGGERLSVEEEAAGLTSVGVECLLHVVSNDDLAALSRVRAARAVVRAGSSRPDLARMAADFQPDLVHAQNLFPLLTRATAELIGTTGLPWIRHLRNYRLRCLSADLWRGGAPCTTCRSAATGTAGVRYGCYRGSRAESAGAVLYSRTEQRLLSHVPPAAYIALNPGMRAALGSTLVPGVPVHVKPDGLTARQPRLGDDGAARTLLFVGRLSDAKGYEHVIELARARPQLRFALVGDGAGAHTVAAAARDLTNLTWERVLPPEIVLERMRDACAVLVPSQWEEPFGRVAAEALSVGTPAVVSARGGLADIVQPVDARLAVDGSGLTSWLAAVDVVTSLDPPAMSRLRRRAWQHFEATFSIERTSRQLADVYRTVLSGVPAE